MADIAEKAIAQVQDTVKELLTRIQTPEKAEALARLMATGPGPTTIPSP